MAAKKTTAKKTTAAKPKTPTLADWLGSDDTYLDTQTSVNKSLQDTLDDITQQKSRYDTTYNNDLRNLGYDAATGQFNTLDPLTQSGRTYGNLAADFASRGMLASSGYGEAVTNTGRQLSTQLTNAATGRQNYVDDLDKYGATQSSDANDALRQAKREAIARFSAKYATNSTKALS